MNNAILVLISVGSEQQALAIAEELVQQELAACVNILPSMRSIYRFKGRVFDDEENLLLIKTRQNLFNEVADIITQMHTYEIPEIIGMPVADCQDNFLKWVDDNVRGKTSILEEKRDEEDY